VLPLIKFIKKECPKKSGYLRLRQMGPACAGSWVVRRILLRHLQTLVANVRARGEGRGSASSVHVSDELSRVSNPDEVTDSYCVDQ
jgi:hypothetical protein